MHSLAVRRTSGAYSIEELKMSEATHNDINQDAILVMKEDEMESVEDIKKQLWIRDEDKDYGVDSYDLEFKDSPMMVLADFSSKMNYMLSNFSMNGWENQIDEVKAVFEKNLSVKLEIGRISRLVGTNDNILRAFLSTNRVSIEDFLLNKKYIVIVNIAEYNRMKFLGMVNELNIERAYHMPYEVETKMIIEDGVWKIEDDDDIRFCRSPYRVLGTVEGKARYALATHESENLEEVLAVLQEVYPELKSVELPKCWYNPEKRDVGYCEDSVLPVGIPLRDFILDKRYVVISDGDEYCIWNDFKKTKLFNRDEYPEEGVFENGFY
jgi:hypothetical protein